jgi:maleylacetate reductase
MQPFVYDQSACRVVFGAGAATRLHEELERLKVKRPLFITTPGRRTIAEEAARSLAGMTAAIYSQAVMHVPVETIHMAQAAAQQHSADSILAFGGGSAIDTSKAVGLQLGLPIAAIPTTYGGSEVTPFYGYTEGGIKKGNRDRKMLPKTVIYVTTRQSLRPFRYERDRTLR